MTLDVAPSDFLDNPSHSDLTTVVRTAVINVKDPEFGAVGNGVTDDTAAIQAAIDYAQSLVVDIGGGGSRAPAVLLPGGHYSITDEVAWKSCHLLGVGSNAGTRLIWNGLAGGTMLVKDTSPGGTSFGTCADMTLQGGNTEPESFIDLTVSPVDVHLILRLLQFNTCTGDAIKTLGWINLHWEHLRWDNIGGYAVLAEVIATQNLSSFAICGFTYDHNRASGAAPGFVLFDNTANMSNVGTAVLSDARVEINTAWSGNKSFVDVRSNPVPNGEKWLGLHLSDIALQESGGSSPDSLVYSSGAGFRPTGPGFGVPISLFLDNVRADGLTSVLGGDWDGFQIPNPASNVFGDVTLGAGPTEVYNGPFGVVGYDPGVDDYYKGRTKGDTEQRYLVKASGEIRRGTGAAAPAVIFAFGAGSPEGVVTAAVGSIYQRTDGGAATSVYFKESGAGNTGWQPK